MKNTLSWFGTFVLVMFGSHIIANELSNIEKNKLQKTLTYQQNVNFKLMERSSKQDIKQKNEIASLKSTLNVLSHKLEISTKKIIVQQNKKIDFWKTIYNIESRLGKNKFQYDKKLGKKPINCRITALPCGHYQINKRALVDIKCTTKQCMIDRNNHFKSLKMARKILSIKLKRFNVKNDWLKYAIYQQGASGIRNIVMASRGKKILSNKIKINIAKNINGLSIKKAKSMTSKKIAKLYLNSWKKLWYKKAIYENT